MTWAEQLDADGYAMLPAVFAPRNGRERARGVDRGHPRQRDRRRSASRGKAVRRTVRNLLELWPAWWSWFGRRSCERLCLKRSEVARGVVRVLYFDKPPGHSWALPWHKDYSLAVQAHGATSTFTKPTVKAGVPQVVSTKDVLDRMLTVRVHLDDATPENGPLRVIPGSHRAYQQKDDPPRAAVALYCSAGDVLLMRPLITHASGHSKTDVARHRRIIHLECAADRELADGYAWKWFVTIRASAPGT